MLRRMIRKLVNWAQYEEVQCETVLCSSSRRDTLHSTRPNINMNFYVGIGGKIVEFVQYDERKDERTSKVYVISDEQSLEQELTRIISLELMRF